MEVPSNGPNGGNGNGNGNGSKPPTDRSEYMRQVRESMDNRRQRVNENLNQFRPHVHDQMNRLFSGYEAPLYARLRGFNSARTLAITESGIVALSASSNRHFEDQETQALAESLITGMNRNVACKWLLTGFAAYMAWRGRKKFRFPFPLRYPTVLGTGGPYDPLRASMPIKSVWHFARFASYYIVGWIVFEPLFQVANMLNQKSTMLADPRLKNLKFDQYNRASMQEPAQEQASWGQQQTQPDFSPEQSQSQPADQSYDQTPQAYYQSSSQPQQQQQQQPQQQQSSWSSYSQPAPYQPQQQQQQQSNNTWDTPAIDDFDDASPVSPSTQNNTNSGGSAWDRIRQQSQQPSRRQQPQQRQQQQQQQQQQQSWAQQSQQQSNEWGNIDDASPQRHPASESYTFSAADEDRATAKSQAQKEFDALVERERYGVEQDRGRWSRK